MIPRSTINHITRTLPLHIHDIPSTSSLFLVRKSHVFRCILLPTRRFVNSRTLDITDKGHNFTEAELESYIEALEDKSTATIHGKTISLHKVMSQCAYMASVRGAELAERVLWLAIGDDCESSLKRSKRRPPRSDTKSVLRYQDFEEDVESTKLSPGPSREMYNMAIQAWTSVAARYGKQQLRENHGHSNYMQTTQTNETENKVATAANRALQILDFMWEEYQRACIEKSNVDDKNYRYNRYMQRLSKGDDFAGSRRSIPPDTVHYTSVIRAFSWNMTSKDSPYQAERLMRQMEELSGIEELRSSIENAGNSSSNISLEKYLNFDRDLIPDRTAYNALLNTFSRNRAIPIKEKVHAMRRIMKRMEEFSRILKDDMLSPNTMSYNLLIMAYGSTTGALDEDCNRGYQAENILKEMISVNSSLHDVMETNLANNHDDVENSRGTLPNIKTYNGVINAWAIDSVKIGASGPLRAESILSSLLQNVSLNPSNKNELDIPMATSVLPDTATFNSVITAWAKSRDINAGSRAERLLQFMHGRKITVPLSVEPSTESGFLQDAKTIHFTNVDRHQLDYLNIEPDPITFNAVVHAWCNSDAAEAAQKAYDLLNVMIAEYKRGNDRCKPTVSSFSATINKVANCSVRNRADMAQGLLEELMDFQNGKYGENFQPSRACFSGVLDALSSVPMIKGASDKAYIVFNKFRKFFHPDVDEYNIILALLSNEIHANDGDALNKIDRCHQLLIEMLQDYEKDRSRPHPNIHSYHHVLRACDHPSKDRETFKVILHIATDTIARLPKPDSQTYILMFKIIQTNQPFHSTDCIEFGNDLLKSCCDEGLLTNAVLKIIERLIPQKYVELKRTFILNKTNEVTGDVPLTVSDLPSEWSLNRRRGQNQKRNRNRR